MKNSTTGLQKILLVLLFMCTWFALVTQFCLNMNSGRAAIPELIVRYFSYFTLDSNILLALCSTFLLFGGNSRAARFFSKQSTQTAEAVYIFVVGLIYNVILRFIWDPQGIDRVADELLHLVNPLLFIVYWALFSNKSRLSYRIVWSWLIYPLVYIFFVLIRSHWSDFYPYPFLDVSKFGWNAVLLNCIGISVLFAAVSLIFAGIGNLLVKKK